MPNKNFSFKDYKEKVLDADNVFLNRAKEVAALMIKTGYTDGSLDGNMYCSYHHGKKAFFFYNKSSSYVLVPWKWMIMDDAKLKEKLKKLVFAKIMTT